MSSKRDGTSIGITSSSKNSDSNDGDDDEASDVQAVVNVIAAWILGNLVTNKELARFNAFSTVNAQNTLFKIPKYP